MKTKNMSDYWSKQSKYFLESDQLGLGAVVYSGMPLWYNKFFDKYQKNTFTELIKGISLKKKRVLDIGCGVGRWTKILANKGAKEVVGVDFEDSRLRKAKALVTKRNANFQKMSILNLKFDNETFDFCNSITVLQHIPYNQKKDAIKEIGRVTKTGGHLLAVELIDAFDNAPHVFPWSEEKWIHEFRDQGFSLVKKIGNEYSIPLRMLRVLRYLITGNKIINRQGGKIKLSKLEILILRAMITISYPLETLCVDLLPSNFARHVGMLLVKGKSPTRIIHA